ncbi:MAG: BadF/BadG/BcrA/BcrD ATPase family protein [Pararhodobacter sp.]
MRICLGIDGGGSGCRARAQLADGRVTADFSGGPANVYSDPDTAIANITTLARRTLKAACEMLGAEDTGVTVSAALGLAGASELGAAPRLRAALGFAQIEVTGDVEAALSGAFHDKDGIIAAIGTGSVYGGQSGGQMRRRGGYGFILGDEGSGAWMGRAALQRTLQARDGLVAPGRLDETLWSHFGALAGMLEFTRAARPADYAALAPMVIEHANDGCPLARALLDEAGDWACRAIASLQPPGGPALPVAFAGGLGGVLADDLAARSRLPWPRVAPLGSPLDGALWRAGRLPPDPVQPGSRAEGTHPR